MSDFTTANMVYKATETYGYAWTNPKALWASGGQHAWWHLGQMIFPTEAERRGYCMESFAIGATGILAPRNVNLDVWG